MATALIAGASGSTGSAAARHLLAHGFDLGLQACSRRNVCEALAASAQTRVLCYTADFKDAQAPAALAQAFIKDFARIDLLVWAVGLKPETPASEADLRLALQVNVRALFLLTKALSRQFLKQKSGALALMTPAAGTRPANQADALCGGALQAWIKSLEREWEPFGVRVRAVQAQNLDSDLIF